MTVDNSLWTYFAQASLIVKGVMFLLLAASVISWTLIFQRGFFIKRARRGLRKFEDRFWSGVELTKLYHDSKEHSDEANGLQNIFRAGFKEFIRTSKQSGQSISNAIEAAQRAMRVA